MFVNFWIFYVATMSGHLMRILIWAVFKIIISHVCWVPSGKETFGQNTRFLPELRLIWLRQCSTNFFASRHPWHLKRTFATPFAIKIDESGAFNEYSKNLATPKKIHATPRLRNTGLRCHLTASKIEFFLFLCYLLAVKTASIV